MADNQTKFDGVVWQITDKKSWFWGEVAKAVMNYEVPWFGFDGKRPPEGQRRTVSLGTVIGWLDTSLSSLIAGVNKANETLAGLRAAVEALGKRQGIDPAELARIIDAAVEKSADKHLSELGTYQLTKIEEKK